MKLTFSSFKYNRFYFIFIFILFLMLTKKLNYKWRYIFVNISRSTSRVSVQIPACFCISWRVRKAEWMVILFHGFHFFDGYCHRTTKQQSKRLYFLSSIFIEVKKRPENSYQTSHLVQNIYISVYLYNVLENCQGSILTHAYDTIDVLLNFKNISPLTSSAITMTGPRK